MSPTDSTGTPLMNVGDLTKPATVLIEKISDAVGGIFRPWQITRVAAAEAEANLVKAQSQLQILGLEERALRRLVKEEARKQDNIESITAKSIPLLRSNAQPDKVNNDWITSLFDKARLVSDADMQQLWASMLAGEANDPGTFSKRTIELVSILDKRDAELFTKFCTCTWSIIGLTPIILDVNRPFIHDSSINFDTIRQLDSLGLIHIAGFGQYGEQLTSKQFTVFYFRKKVVLQLPNDNVEFLVGNTLFTKSGAELAKICGSVPDKVHFEQVIDHWIAEKYYPYELIDDKPIEENWYSA